MPTPAFKSIPEVLLHRIASTPDAEAFQYPEGEGWRSLSWRQTGERVRDIACGLKALGLKPEERCALLAGTRFAWIAADLGILCAGGATTTIYPSNTPEDCAFILSDSGAAYVFAENDEQVAKLVAHRAELPALRKVITFDGKAGHDGWVITLAELEEQGRAQHTQSPAAFEQTIRAVRPDSLATLIYTSGTTGRPKGVELTQDNWLYEAEAIEALQILSASDVKYLWLPLAHAFGKVFLVAQLRIGFRVAVDGRVDKLTENLALIRPTFVAAVPRIFEKIHNKMVSNAKQAGGAKYAIFKWAMGVGKKTSARGQERVRVGLRLGAKRVVADKLVFSKLRERFGGRIRFFISGSAPLSRELTEVFHSCGILILEGYGLTESSAASFVNLPHRFRFGTVGPALPGTEVKILPEDGEVLLRGRGIMRGYHGLPEATAEALDQDGWLHTGDIGVMENGLLRLTDRKKDLIKTSVGKYVAPQALEGKLKMLCPYISQVVVHGNTRNFCSALISLDEEAISHWARENGLGGVGYEALSRHERVKALIQQSVTQLNAGLPNYERVGKFALLPADLTLESGDLTPSLKIKRKVVEQKYKAVLDGFYAGSLSEA